MWIVGKLRFRNDKPSLHCQEISPYEIVDDPSEILLTETIPRQESNGTKLKALNLTLHETANPQADEERLRETMKLLIEYPGNDSVLLDVLTNGKVVRLDSTVTTTICPELTDKLTTLLGSGTVREQL